MKRLLVIQGPTGVGKTDITLLLAEHYGCPILNADSRQLYRDMPIGTAAPTLEQQRRVKHFFVGMLGVDQEYNAGQYERDAISLLERLFEKHEVLVLSGGSMMYVDAVCKGFDDLPDVRLELRLEVQRRLRDEGLGALQEQLRQLDPAYYEQVDLSNPQRVCHALELCLQTGSAYSSLRTGRTKKRDFSIFKVGLTMPREQLYERINKRVDQMMSEGLAEEAHRLLEPYVGGILPNSLNTVGYKEFMQVERGEWTEEFAVSQIKQNTRRYAKRQLTWLRHDADIHWININDYESKNDIISAIVTMHDCM